MKNVKYLIDGRQAVMQDDIAARLAKKGKIEILNKRQGVKRVLPKTAPLPKPATGKPSTGESATGKPGITLAPAGRDAS